MEKDWLINILNELLLPLGFKKKGNFWVLNATEISKMINLQKSRFSNEYYLNYGYIITALSLNGEMMHVFNRLGSANLEENERIARLLDMDSKISVEERTSMLQKMLYDNLISKISKVNTEQDLLADLKKGRGNNISLAVRKYLKL
jgi:hypothetical protein